MQSRPRRFKEFFLGSYQSNPSGGQPIEYHPERRFRNIGRTDVAGLYEGKYEPTHRVRGPATPERLRQMAVKAKQDSIYGISASGLPYLVEKSGRMIRMEDKRKVVFPRLTSPIIQNIKENVHGGSLYQSRGGYTLEVAAYPGTKKTTARSLAKTVRFIRSRRTKVRVSR